MRDDGYVRAVLEEEGALELVFGQVVSVFVESDDDLRVEWLVRMVPGDNSDYAGVEAQLGPDG